MFGRLVNLVSIVSLSLISDLLSEEDKCLRPHCRRPRLLCEPRYPLASHRASLLCQVTAPHSLQPHSVLCSGLIQLSPLPPHQSTGGPVWEPQGEPLALLNLLPDSDLQVSGLSLSPSLSRSAVPPCSWRSRLQVRHWSLLLLELTLSSCRSWSMCTRCRKPPSLV